MKERSIIMSGESVRAILDGRKTQTRGLVKPQPPSIESVRVKAGIDFGLFTDHHSLCPAEFRVSGPVWAVRELCGRDTWLCPLGGPGDRLWIRESWGSGDGMYGEECDPPRVVAYRADQTARQYGIGGEPDSWLPVPDYDVAQWNWSRIKWRSPMFMPRWASRLTLDVLSVRAERLQEITEEDALAEGMPQSDGNPGPFGATELRVYPVKEFRHYWYRTDEKRASWDSNPWVWRVEFRKVDP